jgi:two-component sensor histidine kinase
MRYTQNFAHAPESVPAARRFAVRALDGLAPDTVETVAVMVSELAANCIRHTTSGFDLTITRDASGIRIETTDYGSGEPTVRSPAITDRTGRGLRIVEALSSSWGVRDRPGAGKTVWFTIAEPTSAMKANAG